MLLLLLTAYLAWVSAEPGAALSDLACECSDFAREPGSVSAAPCLLTTFDGVCLAESCPAGGPLGIIHGGEAFGDRPGLDLAWPEVGPVAKARAKG